MILKVVADAGQCHLRADPRVVEHLRIADTTELKQPRGADNARTEDDFPARPDENGLAVVTPARNTGSGTLCPLALHHHLRDIQVGVHAQVGARCDRPQIATRSTGAEPALARLLVVPDRWSTGADVRVIDPLQTQLLAGPHHLATNRRRRRHPRHLDRTVTSAARVFAVLPGFGAAVVGQAIVEIPARSAALFPGVDVGGKGPHVEQSVDGARTAQPAAAREQDFALARLRFGRRFEAPSDARMVEQTQKTRGNVNKWMAVAPARLDEDHLVLATGRQPVGQHTACRTGADDHIVGKDFFVERVHAITLQVWP